MAHRFDPPCTGQNADQNPDPSSSQSACRHPGRGDALHLLLAPSGQLSSDGQLRELMGEHRRHAAAGGDGEGGEDSGGEDGGGLWFLPEALCRQHFGLERMEGLVARASSTAIWLQLRFGGQLQTINLPSDWLCAKAMALPPSAPDAPVGAAAAGRAV